MVSLTRRQWFVGIGASALIGGGKRNALITDWHLYRATDLLQKRQVANSRPVKRLVHDFRKECPLIFKRDLLGEIGVRANIKRVARNWSCGEQDAAAIFL